MTENKIKYISNSGSMTEAEIKVSVYKKNHGICVELKNEDTVSKITRNIDSDVIEYGNYVDVAENPAVAAILVQNDMGFFLPGAILEKDNVKYPFFIFNKNKLMQLDPAGVSKYEEIIALDNVFAKKQETEEIVTTAVDEISLFGKPALLIGNNFDKNTLPEGLFAYDIRGAASNEDGLSHIEESVAENKCGSVVVFEKLDISSSGYLAIGEEDLSFTDNGCQNVKDFCEKHGFTAKPDVVVRKSRNI